jgi:hypothetical protein
MTALSCLLSAGLLLLACGSAPAFAQPTDPAIEAGPSGVHVDDGAGRVDAGPGGVRVDTPGAHVDVAPGHVLVCAGGVRVVVHAGA